MKNKFFVILIFFFLFSTIYSESTVSGIVNDDKVRIRDFPGINGKILERSENRFYIDGMNSYWLKIKKGDVVGWVYGAYININNTSYYSLEILDNSKFANEIDLNYSRSIEQVMLSKIESDILKKQNQKLFFSSSDSLYQRIAILVNNKQSIREVLLPSVEIGISETDRYFILSSSELSEYIQQNYSGLISISPLITIDNNVFFWLTGFNQLSNFSEIAIKAIAFRITQVNDTTISNLKKKYIIDQVIISPYSLFDFNNNNKDFSIFLSSTLSKEIPDYVKLTLTSK